MQSLDKDSQNSVNYFIAILLIVLVGAVAFYLANIRKYVYPQTYRMYKIDLEERVKNSIQTRFQNQGVSVKRFYIDYKRGADWLSGVFTYGKIATFSAILETQEPTGQRAYEVNITVNGKDVEWTIATQLEAEAIATQTVKAVPESSQLSE